MPAAAAAPAAPPAAAEATLLSATDAGARLEASAKFLKPRGSKVAKERPPLASDASILWSQLHRFLFPPNLEHPESTGRLELFAKYGPVDSEGRLRGGVGGSHVHTDGEIRKMIHHETREGLFSMFKKPRDNVEVVVDQLLPVALAHNYTLSEVRKLLSDVPVDSTGRMRFSALQDVILANQTRRLQLLVKDGVGRQERGPKVAYQNEAGDLHMAILRKKKLNYSEEQLARHKRLANYSTLVAGIEEQNLAKEITANVMLVRAQGKPDDRWDRYCNVRRTGKSSYVKAANELRNHDFYPIDDGLANKHQGCSSLRAASLAR